jgi:hypothetical protein
MLPTYKLIAVPLDVAVAETSVDRFRLLIVSNLQFPPGNVTPAIVANAVSAHPLLALASGRTIRARAITFSVWQAAAHIVNPATSIPLTLSYVGTKSLASLRETLGRCLVRAIETQVAPVRPDARFDALLSDDFVDVAQAHDDLAFARADFYSRAAASLGFSRALALDSFSVDDFSYAQARWLNAYVQAALLEAIFGEVNRMQTLAAGGNALAALTRLRPAVPARAASSTATSARAALGDCCRTNRRYGGRSQRRCARGHEERVPGSGMRIRYSLACTIATADPW